MSVGVCVMSDVVSFMFGVICLLRVCMKLRILN